MTKEFNIDLEEMKRLVESFQPSVSKNLTIITKKEAKQDVVYHIAKARQKEMYPFVSKRAMEGEDNSVPRVHTSMNLLDCFIGYSAVASITTSEVPLASKKDSQKSDDPYASDYKGGFYIHEIPFEVALKPNKKLVPGAKESDEIWLVKYNDLTASYPASIVGKMVMKSVQFLPRVGLMPEAITTFVAEVTAGHGITLDSRKRLGKGYWNVVFRDNTVDKYTAITKQEYMETKEYSAALLSEYIEVPRFLKW